MINNQTRCKVSTLILLIIQFYVNQILAKTPHCVIKNETFALSMKCQRLNLTDIPQNISGDVTKLYLDNNNLTKLWKDSFAECPRLSYLNLSSNAIWNIDDNTFSLLLHLETLDLSYNKLNQIPEQIIQLPMLKYLELKGNLLNFFNFTGSMHSRLKLLDLSNNFLQTFPHLSIFPKLQELLVSDNKISRISLYDIAHLCSLKLLTIMNNLIFKYFNEDSCTCHSFRSWLKRYNISVDYIQPFVIDHYLSCNASVNCASNGVSKLSVNSRLKCKKDDENSTIKYLSSTIYNTIVGRNETKINTTENSGSITLFNYIPVYEETGRQNHGMSEEYLSAVIFSAIVFSVVFFIFLVSKLSCLEIRYETNQEELSDANEEI